MYFIARNHYKIVLISLLSMLLSACGFHLRGDYNVPEQLNTLPVTSYDQYSKLTRMMKNQLRMNEIVLVSPAENIPNLKLVNETESSRTLSVYQNTRAAELSITLTVNYTVTIPGIGTKSLKTSVTRSYLDNPLTALAKSVEKEMILDEMRQVTTSQIIRQLARLKTDFDSADNDESSVNSDQITTTATADNP